MPRYFVSKENIDNLYVDGANYHHMAIVNRIRIGEHLELSCDEVTYDCEVTNITKEKVFFKVCDEFYFDTEFSFNVTLLQCYPKGDKMEEIIKHTTELGVTSIIPILSERSVVKLDAKKIEAKQTRLQAIANEASKQCKRNVISKIENIQTFSDVDYDKYNVKIFAYEALSKDTSKKFLEIINNIKPKDNVIIAIGPEGGFSTKEAEFLINKGFISVSLGKRILRTETAGVYCLSAIGVVKE